MTATNKKITDGNYDKALAVKCVNGTFVGKKTENIIAYRGIPFVGRQPVGGLRWKAPVEFGPDDGIYEAYYSGKSPFQHSDFSGAEDTLDNQGEDCLYLNIWKAEDAGQEKKPVMVWIHGGAFEFGAAAFSLFDCHNFVRENPDVIVVTVAYRLGVMGFLHLDHLPDGKEYPDAQNLGLLDQLMGLKWVHENIEAFGGDPDNVTIFGESAGAGSVTQLPLIPGSHAYIRRVIGQSGSPTLSRSREEAIDCTKDFMEGLGCKTVADLMKLDARTIVDSSDVVRLRTAPERDGRYLPLDPYQAYADGALKDIDLLVGCNLREFDWFAAVMGDEGIKILAEDRRKKKFVRLNADEMALIDSFCRDIEDKGSERECRLFDQIWFNTPVIRMAENQTNAGGRAYVYYFTAESGHGVELPVVFHHQEPDDGRVFDETFARTLRRMWVQFAKTGDPSLSAEVSPDGKAKEWPVYDTKNRQLMVFDEFDVHPEKESDRKLVDWERTYFLTKHYLF